MFDTAEVAVQINESNTKIQYTKEYGFFHFLKGNRDLNEAKIEKIVKSVKSGLNFFKYCPILVNEDHFIIDGQHRFWACRKLNLPVYFVVVPNFSLRQIAEYVGFLNVLEDFQVVRIAQVSKTMRMNYPARYYFHEVMQNFINPEGKVTTMSLNVNGLSYCYDQWCWSSEITLKDDYNPYGGFRMRQNISPYLIHPDMKIKPEYERNGYRGQCCGIAPHILMNQVLMDTKTETLLKMNQLGLLNYYYNTSSGPFYRYWSSIKICFRNNYIVKDASVWFDYLELLEYFNKDVKNAHYVCPENLNEVHDKLMNKKREIERKNALVKKQEQLIRDQKEYEKQKAKFFDLLFTQDNLIIKPLRSVEEFMHEGDTLHHCVYTNAYYNRPESLIMSARIDDKPIETIEVSLKTLDIVQSRGLQNKPSEYHDQIISLVKRNIDVIAQKKSSKRTQKIAV